MPITIPDRKKVKPTTEPIRKPGQVKTGVVNPCPVRYFPNRGNRERRAALRTHEWRGLAITDTTSDPTFPRARVPTMKHSRRFPGASWKGSRAFAGIGCLR
jgi:hypothetical protein